MRCYFDVGLIQSFIVEQNFVDKKHCVDLCLVCYVWNAEQYCHKPSTCRAPTRPVRRQ